jgi:hypothetical protein
MTGIIRWPKGKKSMTGSMGTIGGFLGKFKVFFPDLVLNVKLLMWGIEGLTAGREFYIL